MRVAGVTECPGDEPGLVDAARDAATQAMLRCAAVDGYGIHEDSVVVRYVPSTMPRGWVAVLVEGEADPL